MYDTQLYKATAACALTQHSTGTMAKVEVHSLPAPFDAVVPKSGWPVCG